MRDWIHGDNREGKEEAVICFNFVFQGQERRERERGREDTFFLSVVFDFNFELYGLAMHRDVCVCIRIAFLLSMSVFLTCVWRHWSRGWWINPCFTCKNVPSLLLDIIPAERNSKDNVEFDCLSLCVLYSCTNLIFFLENLFKTSLVQLHFLSLTSTHKLWHSPYTM